jgi:hypothetical protein
MTDRKEDYRSSRGSTCPGHDSRTSPWTGATVVYQAVAQPPSLVREWHAQILRMTGTKAALDSYQSIMRPVAAAAKQQNKAK